MRGLPLNAHNLDTYIAHSVTAGLGPINFFRIQKPLNFIFLFFLVTCLNLAIFTPRNAVYVLAHMKMEQISILFPAAIIFIPHV